MVTFGVGPMYLFVLQHRLPVGLMRSTWHFWLSTMATNLAIAVLAPTMIWLVGLGPFLLVQLPITLLAGSASGCSERIDRIQGSVLDADGCFRRPTISGDTATPS